MNLAEFIEENGIKSVEGEAFAHSPEFWKMREFERTWHEIRGVLFLDPETYEVRELDVVLRGSVQEKWDKKEKKAKRWFFVDRRFKNPHLPEGCEDIEDTVAAGKTIDEAVETLEAERKRFEFFQRYELIDTGRYWLNKDLKRCVVDDGQVVVID